MQNKCCNCGGWHIVIYGGYEVRKRAVEIEQVKAVNNISYAEAVKEVQGQREKEETDKDNQPLSSEVGQAEEELDSGGGRIIFLKQGIKYRVFGKGTELEYLIVEIWAKEY